MRPTDLGFRSPREVSQAPYYNPPITCKGQTASFNRPTHKRSKSSQAIRFFDPKDSVQHTSIFLGPGRYRDDYNSISHAVKSKIRPKYKGDTIDTKSGPYTYVGGSKILDLGFVSPQNRKKPPTVLTTSINLASTTSKNTPVGSSDQSINFSFNKGPPSSSGDIQTKRNTHHRTSSLQTTTSVGRRTPLDRAITSTNPLLTTDLSGKKLTEGPRTSHCQKQRNDDVYNSYLELQLSHDLKSIKKDLEEFQKKKPPTSGETSKLCSRSGSIHIGSLINAMEKEAVQMQVPTPVSYSVPIKFKEEEENKRRNNTEEEEEESEEHFDEIERVLECREEEEGSEGEDSEIPEEGKEMIYYQEAARSKKNEKSQVLKDSINYEQYFKNLEASFQNEDLSGEMKKLIQKPKKVETYTVNMKEQVKEVFISKGREQKAEKTLTANRLMAGAKKRPGSGTNLNPNSKEGFGLRPVYSGYYPHNLSYSITGSKGKTTSFYGLRKI